jgi:JmjC domain, hydroxylase
MNLLSINYLHAGAPKYWYAIAPEHAKRFESLAQSHFVHAARDCPEFLRHKQNMLSPTILKKAGVPYEIVVQRPGDAIVTSPGAYHFGVNLGFNIAEATNFGIPEWIPKGREAKVCMCRPNAVRIDVDRFADLLARYEEDTKNSRMMGLQPLSHREWTLFQARRIKATKIYSGTVLESSKTEIPKDKEFWVEVMQPLNADGKSLAVSKSSGSKRRKKNSVAALGTECAEEWRLAKPLGNKKAKLQLEQKVLCLLPGKKEGIDGEVTDEEECFAGVVKEFADDHCRVHFSGLKKDDDVWIALTDPKLFLDGGKWDAEAVIQVKPAASKGSTVKPKNIKRKVAGQKPVTAKATKAARTIRSKKAAKAS